MRTQREPRISPLRYAPVEMTNLFAHWDEWGAPEERTWKGFARLAKPRLAHANLGHPYGVATTSAAASVHCFVNLPQQASWLEMTNKLVISTGA